MKYLHSIIHELLTEKRKKKRKKIFMQAKFPYYSLIIIIRHVNVVREFFTR